MLIKVIKTQTKQDDIFNSPIVEQFFVSIPYLNSFQSVINLIQEAEEKENNYNGEHYTLFPVYDEDYDEEGKIYIKYGWTATDFIYAVRSKTTGKLISVKCKGGKFYARKSDAINRCTVANNGEVVTYVLMELMED